MIDLIIRHRNDGFWVWNTYIGLSTCSTKIQIVATTVDSDVIVIGMKGGANFTITDGKFTSANMPGSFDGEITGIGNIICDMAHFTATESAVLTAGTGNTTL
jgi:hypothetical protein